MLQDPVRCLTNWLVSADRARRALHADRYTLGQNAQAQQVRKVHRLHRHALSPSYCLTAACSTRCTTYPASCRPSTSQYQLNVDSTATPWICPAHERSAEMMPRDYWARETVETTRSVSSSTTTMLLLECKSIPGSSMSASLRTFRGKRYGARNNGQMFIVLHPPPVGARRYGLRPWSSALHDRLCSTQQSALVRWPIRSVGRPPTGLKSGCSGPGRSTGRDRQRARWDRPNV